VSGPARIVGRLGVLLVAALLGVLLRAHHVSPAPDLVVVAVTAFALVDGTRGGALWGLLGGWLVDLAPPGATVLGLGALLTSLGGFVAGRGRRVDRLALGWVVLVAGAAAAAIAAVRVLLALMGGMPVAWSTAGLGIVLTAATAGLLVPLLIRFDDRLAGERR
jgi:rod shape-determining protein MreD